MTELPDECDFCQRTLEPDEELEPVWIGEPPKQRAVQARATAKKQQKVIGRRPNKDADLEVLGRPVDEISAILKALEQSDQFELDVGRAVMSTGKEVRKSPRATLDTLKAETDENKVGATIRAKTEPRMQKPDMELCEFCAESFKGEQ